MQPVSSQPRQRLRLLPAILVPLSAALLASCGGSDGPGLVVVPAPAPPPQSSLPTCSELTTDPRWGVAGNPAVVSATSRQKEAQTPMSIGSPRPGAAVRFPATPSHCEVDLELSSLEGPKDGYAPGERQSVFVRISLPEKSDWKERLMAQGGSGMQGTVEQTGSFGEGADYEAYLYYAVRLGMIGTTTDAGHRAAENATFALTADRQLNTGKIEDWTYRASLHAVQWGKVLAQNYYGKSVKYTYFNGGSGGGYQGMGQLQKHAREYDGFLIGTPAQYHTMLQMTATWQGLVIRDRLTAQGKTLSQAQVNAARASAIAACDAQDGVTDGLLADPRACSFSATANICGTAGAPAAPECLDSDQAAVINMIWDGPRNKNGQKIWFGWDRSQPFPVRTNINAGFGPATFRWALKDPTFDPERVYLDEASRAAAGNPAGSWVFADLVTVGTNALSDYIDNADPALDAARAQGVKVIQTVGNYDRSIFWRQSLHYYRQVARYFGNGTADYAALHPWYRLFIMPGVGDGAFHTISPDATGPAALDPFLALMDWVENGKAPDRILAGAGKVPNRTRPLCPYPQWAQYIGSGSTESAQNFVCAGNLETPAVVAADTLAPHKRENGN